MKHLIFLFLFPALLAAQVPTKEQLKEARQITRDLQRDYDFVLDPIEQIGIEPRSFLELNQGNWGNVALETDKHFDEIIRRASRRVHVYIFDTAGKFSHDALTAVEREGRTFTGEPDPLDGNGHGTHCAGIIGGVAEFPLGAARALIEKELLYIYPVKVLNNGGSGLFSWIQNGITWANGEAKKHVDNGDFVIYSFSLGASSGNQGITDALNAAAAQGVLIVAAAGNTGGRGVNFPGNVISAKAIAALQNTQPISRASFSTYGPEVFAGLPGAAVLSSYKGNSYATLSGTSMATPHAAAMGAIAASIHAKLNAGQIADVLRLSSVDIAPNGRDEHTGYGVPLASKILAYDPGTVPDKPTDPEPPKPVEPVKPERTQLFGISESLSAVWGRQGSNDWQPIEFLLQVEYTHKRPSDRAAKDLLAATRDHFTNRGYYLFADSDEADCLYWIAHFYEMLMKREGYPVRVARIQGIGPAAVILDSPIRGRVTTSKAVKAGAFTFDRI
jgi:hypothetical protein